MQQEEFMNKAIGLVVLVAGLVLIVTGYNASQSFSSDVSRLFTGSATNKAMWMLVWGTAAALVGAVLMNRRNP
jgi:drug/metabolite transporter (DMT)-like permease